MQVVTILAQYDITLGVIDASFLSKVNSQDVQITLVKDLKLLLQSLLMIPNELSKSAFK